jgi:hypothetical protein
MNKSFVILPLVSVVVGCSAMVKLDGYKEAPPPASTTASVSHASGFENLKLTMLAMKPHVGQMVEARVVDPNNFIQFRAVISAIDGSTDVTINAPNAIPKMGGSHRLDFYADMNHSGGYDGIGSVVNNDHAWRIDPLTDFPEGAFSPVEGLVQVNFGHNTSFTDIDQYPVGTSNRAKDTTLGARVHVTGLDAFGGKLLNVRISDTITKHTVAVYRVPEIQGGKVDAVVPGCVEPGADYQIDVYVDANGNHAYDDPSQKKGDLGFRAQRTSTEQGLEVSVDVAPADQGNIDVGEP